MFKGKFSLLGLLIVKICKQDLYCSYSHGGPHFIKLKIPAVVKTGDASFHGFSTSLSVGNKMYVV